LAELQTLRTPLKEQHDHLKRLILTGSPRSSYATANTLELHTNNQHPGGSATTTGLIRKKSVGTKRPSRLSEAATGPAIDTPTKRVGWKELFFDEHPGDVSFFSLFCLIGFLFGFLMDLQLHVNDFYIGIYQQESPTGSRFRWCRKI
jgi:hypothetical protein